MFSTDFLLVRVERCIFPSPRLCLDTDNLTTLQDIICAFPLDFVAFLCGANASTQLAFGVLRFLRGKRILEFVRYARNCSHRCT